MQDVPTVIATVGGEGTRLFPLTLRQPKPLVSLCGKAILGRIFETLAAQGCREFILASKGAENTNRLNEYFKEGRGFSDRLKLRPEAIFRYQPNYNDAGNADAVRFCMEYYNIKGDILVVSGDNVIDIDLQNLMEYHRKKKSLLTVGIKELGDGEDISQYGVAELRDENRIKRFVEKPEPAEAPSRLINTSIYVFSPEIRKVFQEMGGEVKDTGKNVIPYLTERGYPVYGYEVEGYWADIGTPGSFLKTSQDILHGKLSRIKFGSGQTTLLKFIGLACAEEKKWIHPSTIEAIAPGVQIGEHVSIGADCRIGNNARIESSFIGDNCIIGEGVKISGSVVMDFVNLERNVYLNKCVVARYATIQENSIIDAEVPVDVAGGQDTTPVVGEGVTILRNSVIGPKKRVAPIYESHKILATGRFIELGYDHRNVYFIEK